MGQSRILCWTLSSNIWFRTYFSISSGTYKHPSSGNPAPNPRETNNIRHYGSLHDSAGVCNRYDIYQSPAPSAMGLFIILGKYKRCYLSSILPVLVCTGSLLLPGASSTGSGCAGLAVQKPSFFFLYRIF